jgi:hypothetical protein
MKDIRKKKKESQRQPTESKKTDLKKNKPFLPKAPDPTKDEPQDPNDPDPNSDPNYSYFPNSAYPTGPEES